MSKILEGNIVKKAHSKTNYTEEQINELLMCDPEINDDAHYYFITNFGYIKHPKLGTVVYQPYGYQEKLIEHYRRNRFSISMMGRQMGKCVAPESTVLIRNKTTGETIEVTMDELFKMSQ